jgi:hypothetical protein
LTDDGVVPEWDNVNGWKFNGGTYLKTGIVPNDLGTILIGFTNYNVQNFSAVCGVVRLSILLNYSGSGLSFQWGTNSFSSYGMVDNGIAAMKRSQAFYNGIPVRPPATDTDPYYGDIWIGGCNASNILYRGSVVDVQSFVYCDGQLSDDDVATFSAAMAALP